MDKSDGIVSWTSELVAHERALALGTQRAPLALPEPFAGEPDGALKLLAAMAVRERHALPPAPPAWVAVPDVVQDRTRYVSDPVRRLLRRCFARKARGNAGGAAPAASRLRVMLAIRATGLALHPFDLDALRELRELDAPPAQPLPDLAAWADAPLSERVSSLTLLHERAPEQARELLVGCLPAETAPTRTKLLDAISGSLTPQDVPLLESRLEDRAKSVWEHVATMLSRLPGTAQYDARLQGAVERLTFRKGGILRKRKVAVDSPRQLGDGALAGWYTDTFSRLAPASLAESVDLSVADMVACLDDPRLAQVLGIELAASGDFASVNALAVRYAGAMLLGLADLPEQTASRLDAEARRTLFAAAVQPDEWRNTAVEMHRCGLAMVALQTPLPASASAILVASSAWRSFLQGSGAESPGKQRSDALDTAALETAVAICADDARPVLHSQLRQSSQQGRGFRALDFCQLLDAIQEATR